MTLADAVFRSLLALDRLAAPGPFARGATVRLIDRTDVYAVGDVGEVLASDREYTSVRIGGCQQTVRTSQLRGSRAEVMPEGLR